LLEVDSCSFAVPDRSRTEGTDTVVKSDDVASPEDDSGMSGLDGALEDDSFGLFVMTRSSKGS